MNVSSILSFDKGGVVYNNLTEEQRRHLKDVFFERDPTKGEKSDFCRYHFTNDKCTHYT